jgi:hypothetical protein
MLAWAAAPYQKKRAVFNVVGGEVWLVDHQIHQTAETPAVARVVLQLLAERGHADQAEREVDDDEQQEEVEEVVDGLADRLHEERNARVHSRRIPGARDATARHSTHYQHRVRRGNGAKSRTRSATGRTGRSRKSPSSSSAQKRDARIGSNAKPP